MPGSSGSRSRASSASPWSGQSGSPAPSRYSNKSTQSTSGRHRTRDPAHLKRLRKKNEVLKIRSRVSAHWVSSFQKDVFFSLSLSLFSGPFAFIGLTCGFSEIVGRPMNVDSPLVSQWNQPLDQFGEVDGKVSLWLVQVLNGGRVPKARDSRLYARGVTESRKREVKLKKTRQTS